MQLLELRRFSGRGRTRHHIPSCLVLGEGDHFADIRLICQYHADAVNPRGDSAVRGRAILERLQHVTEALARNLRVMDATAISLCRENRLLVMVFDLSRPGNILRVLRGEPIGTMVKGE